MNKLLTIIGDPTSIDASLKSVFDCNPEMQVISMTSSPYMVDQKAAIHLSGHAGKIPVHVLYVTYKGPELVNANGEPLIK